MKAAFAVRLSVCIFLSPQSRGSCNCSNMISAAGFWNELLPVCVPTSGGHALAGKAKTLLADYDSTMAEVRRLVSGESERLRISYVASAVQQYLGPALATLRRQCPRKVKMLHQTPGEMIIALQRGEIDLALTRKSVSRDFLYSKTGECSEPCRASY